MKKSIQKARKAAAVTLSLALAGSMLFVAPEAAAASKKKAKVKLNKTRLTLRVGKTYKLKLKNNKKKIKWSSSKKKVATVSKKGKVKAKKAGTTRITAKVGKKKYVCKVTVKNKKKTTKTTMTKKPTVTKAPANNTNTVKATPSPTPYVAATDFTLDDYPTAMEITGDNVWPLNVSVSPSNATEKVKFTVDNPELATVDSNYNFKANGIGKVTVTASIANGKTKNFVCDIQEPYQTSSHDPSVVKGDDGYYYIFGSHLAFARTDNLIGWTQVTNNVTKDTSETGSVFASYWENWAKYNKNGVANKDNSGNDCLLKDNQWAPDVIYNKAMKKWCMYMSVNGPDLNSVIVLLTADKLDGDWTVQGPVIYSGLTTKDGVEGHNFKYTDYEKTTGESTLASRYLTGNSYNPAYQTNAIDPCVKYDAEGNLWMSYGSWFGGIYFIKLDAKTGLRDYSYTYKYDTDDTDGTTSDPYMGIRVAGGGRATGEASYIIQKDDYYYMFESYGGLTAIGNYNMRVFRSKNITGPYVDKQGRNALRTSKNTTSVTGNIGIRLMAGYKWSCNSKGYLAQGHNSALVDDDGRMFLVYHTRFTNSGETHQVRTHQMFMSEDGWLCVAPYTYNGEKISASGYDKKEVAGTYEYIYHEPSTAGGSVVNSTYITLYENGTVGGVDAGGTWSMKSGKPYVDFTIKGVKYQGVFSYGYDESAARNRVMTFTAVGANNVCIWGSKTLKDPKTESGSVTAVSNAITVPSSATADFDLPLGGAYGSTVSWKVTAADNAVAVQGSKAVVKRHLKDSSATLTATITKGTSSATKTYKVAVPGLLNDIQIETVVKSDSITLPKTLDGGYAISWTSSDTSVINPATGAVTRPAAESKDVTLTATVTGNGETETKGFSVKVLTKGDIQYLYTQDYESVTDITTLFASANMAGGISLGTENDNHFLKFAQDSSSGNRGGKAADFGITAGQSSYIVEMDVALTSGNVANRSQSQLVLTSTDSTTDKANNNGGMADADAYILKLDTTKNTTGQLQTDWYINGTQNKLTIPSGTWVHLQVEVNVTAKTLKVVATNGDTVLGTVDNVAFTGNGTPKGFYVLSGRGSGVTQIDNIKVQ